MILQKRICLLTLCTFFVLNGFSRASDSEAQQTKSLSESNASSKDDIFIDDAQADVAESGAAANAFSDQDERWSSSGMGPDDEDAFEGSGEGSGVGVVYKEPSGVHPIPASPTKTEYVPKKQHTDDVVSRILTDGFVTIPPAMRPSPPKVPPPDSHTTTPATTTTPTTTTTTTTTTTSTTPIPNNYPEHPDENKVPDVAQKVPDKIAPPQPPSSEDKEDLDNEIPQGSDISTMNRKSDERSSSFFSQPGILAAVIGGAVVGLLCAILLVMFIVYRMRKKDEGKVGKLPPAQRGYEQGLPYDWKSQGSGWPSREKC